MFLKNGWVLNGALFVESVVPDVLAPLLPTCVPERNNFGRARSGATPTSGFGRTRLGASSYLSSSSSADETWGESGIELKFVGLCLIHLTWCQVTLTLAVVAD